MVNTKFETDTFGRKQGSRMVGGTQEASTELILFGLFLCDVFTGVHHIIVFYNLQMHCIYSFVVSNIT